MEYESWYFSCGNDQGSDPECYFLEDAHHSWMVVVFPRNMVPLAQAS